MRTEEQPSAVSDPNAAATKAAREGGETPRAAGRSSRLTQHELANLVGATRENVNKCLQEWRRVGIIRMEKRVISIADRDALESLAAPE